MRTLPFWRIVLPACLGCLVFTGAPFGVKAEPTGYSILPGPVGSFASVPNRPRIPQTQLDTLKTGTFSFRLKNYRDEPFQGVFVTLTDKKTGQTYTNVTGVDGCASLYDLPHGKYRVRIHTRLWTILRRWCEIGPKAKPQSLEWEMNFPSVCGMPATRSPVEEWVSRSEQRFPEFTTFIRHLMDGDENVRPEAPPATDLTPELENLFQSARFGDFKTVKTALDHGLSPNVIGEDSRTLFMEACSGWSEETPQIVRYMLSVGADPNAVDKFGETPLMFAVSNGKLETVKLLLESGANPLARNCFGISALTYARHQPECLKELVRAGADCNAQDDQGRSILMLAAFEGDAEIVGTILASGANPMLRDNDGYSVLTYAEEGRAAGLGAPARWDALIERLKKAGAVE
jgi:hypothetical protein